METFVAAVVDAEVVVAAAAAAAAAGVVGFAGAVAMEVVHHLVLWKRKQFAALCWLIRGAYF